VAKSFKTVVSLDDAGSAASESLRTKVSGDTQSRLSIDAGGKLTWGSGAATGDVNLYRDAADVLRTDDTLRADEGLAGPVKIPVKNTSASTIAKGIPVYATGSVGASGAVEVSPSAAGTSATMPALGLTESSLAVNGEGYALVLGVVSDVDTSSYTINASLYVASSGGLTTTRPTASSDLVQKIGRVVRVHASTGQILVLGAGRTNDVPNAITITNGIVGGSLSVGTEFTLPTADGTVDQVISTDGAGALSWVAQSGGGGSITTGDAAPSSPSDGDLWYETDTGRTLVYYSDGTSSQWVEVGSASAAAGGATTQVQYNSSGSLAGNANFVYDATNNRVGIGTTSPSELLDVSGDANAQGSAIPTVRVTNADAAVASGNVAGSFEFYSKDASEADKVSGFVQSVAEDAGTKFGLTLGAKATGADAVEAVRIDSDGNVGIGTATPLKILHVEESDSGVTPSTSHHIVFESADDMGILIGSGTTKNGYIRFGDSDSQSSGGFNYDHNDNSLKIRTNGTDHINISSAGNVGIGTSSPTLKFQVNGSAGFNDSIQTGASSYFFDPWAGSTIALGNYGSLGTQGSYRTSLSWNWGRHSSGYEAFAVNSYTSAAGIELGNDGIIFRMSSSYSTSAPPTEVARFDANGHFEVGGTTQPGTDAPLYVQHSGNSQGISVYTNTSSSTSIIYKGYSNYGGTQSLKFDVRTDGDVNYDGVLTDTSDVRLKTDITDTDLGLGFIEALRPVSYRRTSGTRRHYGFIAQEVAAVLGDDADGNAIWVERRDLEEGESSVENPQGLRYNHFIAPLVKAVQELSARIETLEAV